MKKRKTSNQRTTKHGGGRSAKRSTTFSALASDLAELGRNFYGRGWVLGTSGNFSAVLSHEPMRLAITSTGLDKGSLTPSHFLEMDAATKVVRGQGKPSAEALL